jgi:hypothetical protein
MPAAGPATAAALTTRRVGSAADLAGGLWPRPPSPPYLTRARLGDLERDPRFSVSYTEVLAGSQPVLAVPAYSPRQRRWPDAAYDAGSLLGLGPGVVADSLCLVGGRADYRCPALEAPGKDGDLLDAAARLALRSIGQDARRDGRTAALLYADIDGRLFRAAAALGMSPGYEILGHRYHIPDVGPGLAQYLSTLSRGKRSMVRRDLRAIAQAGVLAQQDTWENVAVEAAPLVAGIHQVHGQTDLPALALARIRRRAGDPDVLAVAFALWSAGRLGAVTLGWVHGRTLELYEVGLAPQPDADRGLRYLEVMFYAPLRFMWRSGLRTLDLAMAAGHPKKLRGAVERPVAGTILGGAPPGQVS